MPKLPLNQIVGWQFSTLGMSTENKKFYFLRFLIKSIRFFFSFLTQMSDVPLQQNVFLVTKISEEIFFVAKNTTLVTKYEFRH